MLDHVFTDAIGALRDSLERAFLERQAFEERFQVDVLLGDVTWETSYGLPGRGPAAPGAGRPHARLADVGADRLPVVDIGEPFSDPPRIEIELVLRVQRLAEAPDPEPRAGGAARGQRADRVRAARAVGPDHRDGVLGRPDEREYAIEVSYEGSYDLDEATLADGTILDDHLSAMGGWIASTLVKLGDLTLPFLPPVDDDH